MRQLLLAKLVAVLFAAHSSASLAASCDAVLNNIQNFSSYDSVETRFESQQADICREEFSTFEAAKDSKSRIGIDVPGYFAGRFGSDTNESNYSQRREAFCSFTFNQFAEGRSIASVSRTIETEAIAAWQSCVLASTRSFSILVLPGSENGTFAVRIAKRDPVNNRFSVRGISFAPDNEASNTCQVTGASQSGFPVNLTGDGTLTCTKDPSRSTIFAISTDSGDFTTELIGTADELAKLRQEVLDLRNELIRVDLPKGTIVATAESECPSGWSVADGANGLPNLVGRFAIGAGELPQGGAVALLEEGGSHNYRLWASGQRAACCNEDQTMLGFGVEWRDELEPTVGKNLFYGRGNFTSTFPPPPLDTYKSGGWVHHLPPYLGVKYCVRN